ncbi:orotidine 5'-phosphate decarboxylase [Streptomyces thinghirensis]|nr:orotidine 5'-phosphate decarboxylase [Streptomyces thinghirensis]
MASRVAVLKPQAPSSSASARAAIAVLEKSVEEARAAGALVVMDAKRGDIGSTMAAAAESFLRRTPRCSGRADRLAVPRLLRVPEAGRRHWRARAVRACSCWR